MRIVPTLWKDSYLIPAVAGLVGKVLSQDYRIGQIALGIGLVTSGAILTTKAVLSSKKISYQTRRGVAALGIGMAAAGVASIYSGIYEFLYVQRTPAAPNLEEVKKEIQGCPEAKKLWDELEGQGEFSIQQNSDMPIQDAFVDPSTRKILVSPSLDKHDTVSNIINGMVSLSHSKEKYGMNPCALRVEEFVDKMMHYEDQITEQTNDILNHCWPNTYGLKDLSAQDPGQYWFMHTDRCNHEKFKREEFESFMKNWMKKHLASREPLVIPAN